MNHVVRPSLFASVLRRLLDETGVFERREWAEFLRVSESAISQWVRGHTLPRAEYLRKVLWVLRNADDVPSEVLDDFERMAAMPAEEVAPDHSKTIGQTVGDYVLSPLLEAFLRDLKRMDPPDRERFLLEAAAKCAEATGALPLADSIPPVLSAGTAEAAAAGGFR
jgi:hypothetical protein